MYYPASTRPPEWVTEFVKAVTNSRDKIDSAVVSGLTSDRVLAAVRPALEGLGFVVESGKTKGGKIRRPVLFGESGNEAEAYEIDGYHEALGIVLEIEAGRGARGNAVYRDLVRTSLIVDAKFLALGVMQSYRHKNVGKEMSVASYRDAKTTLDAIFASGRLKLPFEGILLFGY
jgi:hypothetical protein